MKIIEKIGKLYLVLVVLFVAPFIIISKVYDYRSACDRLPDDAPNECFTCERNISNEFYCHNETLIQSILSVQYSIGEGLIFSMVFSVVLPVVLLLEATGLGIPKDDYAYIFYISGAFHTIPILIYLHAASRRYMLRQNNQAGVDC